MTLKFSTSGRPMVECINPDCKKLHSIYRRGDYVNRAQTRVSCRSCGTKWSLSADDQVALQQHYEQRQQELAAKKHEKEKKNQDNSEQQQKMSKPKKQENTTKKVDSVKTKKKSFLDELFS